MRVAIVENSKITHSGQVGIALAEAGAETVTIRAYAGEALPQLEDFDALVVFGGEQNARDDEKHPYLPHLADLMRRFGDSEKSLLGICLGSQLLARAYGAENLIGAAPEFGWCGIEKTIPGKADPVLAAVPNKFLSFQWHDDTFTLPPGALHLAENESARHQAFRMGRAAYGFQFHFEANRTVVRDWLTQFPEVVDRKEPGWAARHDELAERFGGLSDEAGLALARAWVATIRG
ncbi:type 1 glutamine amidotransferase [Rhizobium glycinendophyticum]|uniref:Type 1 glutamine amidotransferase n=1 Tax=Rhizobium glycinendophyticum TaxID=2589807 RepID=A0A504UWP6_9HYPH|nr:type 1 glutamine amidotransferase [Rhizobium glycinendophyticum]TPP09493.1 type 1 glutamine amidotransferase [Rhizobium glycinendophyticum]